jgi:hypothetical protein
MRAHSQLPLGRQEFFDQELQNCMYSGARMIEGWNQAPSASLASGRQTSTPPRKPSCFAGGIIARDRKPPSSGASAGGSFYGEFTVKLQVFQ